MHYKCTLIIVEKPLCKPVEMAFHGKHRYTGQIMWNNQAIVYLCTSTFSYFCNI